MTWVINVFHIRLIPYLYIPVPIEVHNTCDDAPVMTWVINVFHISRAVSRIACDHRLQQRELHVNTVMINILRSLHQYSKGKGVVYIAQYQSVVPLKALLHFTP